MSSRGHWCVGINQPTWCSSGGETSSGDARQPTTDHQVRRWRSNNDTWRGIGRNGPSLTELSRHIHVEPRPVVGQYRPTWCSSGGETSYGGLHHVTGYHHMPPWRSNNNVVVRNRPIRHSIDRVEPIHTCGQYWASISRPGARRVMEPHREVCTLSRGTTACTHGAQTRASC